MSPDELDQRINAALAPLRQELRELRLELNQLKQMAGLSAQEQSPSGRSESFQQGLTLSGPDSAASGGTYSAVSGKEQSQSGRSQAIEQDQTLSGSYPAVSGGTYASVSGTQQSQSGRSQSIEQNQTLSGSYPAVSGGGGGIWSRLLGLPSQAPFLQRFQQSVQLIQQESIPSRPAAFAAVELIELVEEEKRQSDLDLPFFSHWDELEPQLLALLQLESLLPQPGESYRSPEQVVVRTARGGQRDTIERCLRCGFRFQGQLLRKAEVSIFV